MNYKLLFPTYRNRYLFVKENLKRLAIDRQFERGLSLGTGEGDYDFIIAPYCKTLIGCDINESDVAFAREMNKSITNLTYQVENALDLSFPDNHFDLIVSVEVLEHVGQPEKMIEEVQRVLKPGGVAIITFPSLEFPFTYDPINRILSIFTSKKISQGAYAFGHEYLVAGSDFKRWADKNNLHLLQERNLSGYIVGLLEMYWTGIIQRIFKSNASNLSGQQDKTLALRPSTKEPFGAKITDAILYLDHMLFSRAKHSVGKGFIIQKQ